MRRKTFLVIAVILAMLLTVGLPTLNVAEAWGNGSTMADNGQKTGTNDFGTAVTAPFRAIGKLFGGGKKRKPATKITEKDIKKFESAQVSKVNDAQTPQVKNNAQTAPATTTGDDSIDHLAKGREFLNTVQLNEAIAELNLAATTDKTGEAQTLLGVAYDQKGLGGLAQEAFEKATHAPDNQAVHLSNLGYWYYRRGDNDQAIKYLKRAVKLSPDDTRIWNNLAMSQIAAAKFEDAYKSMVHAIGEFDSHVKIATRLEWSGHSKAAIKHLEKARALQPTSTNVLADLTRLYYGAGEIEKAQSARQALTALQTVATAPTQK